VCYYQAKIANPQGPSDWTMFTLDNVIDSDIAVAEIDGCPALVYSNEDASVQYINYAYADTPAPDDLEDWTITEAVECPASVNGMRILSLCEIDGRPAVGYFHETLCNCYYMLATSAAPLLPADWVGSLVGSSSYPSYQPAVSVFNGYPAVVYRDLPGQELVFAKSDMYSPTSEFDWDKHAIAGGINENPYYSVAVHDDGMYVAYMAEVETYENGWQKHPLLYSFDTYLPRNENGWKFQDVLDPDFGGYEGMVGAGGPCVVSMAASVNGKPHIAFFNHDDGAVSIAHTVPSD
jgi:hypothetical protein